ncbi:DUF6233 domain-containing protein [Streptomyces sp. NPDC005728]|uniref:DUF6233 domain-containing protein n=1 Tax=Streptomyces sp. NPDC005728 TaxID=3157054 RepID=UPI003405F36D
MSLLPPDPRRLRAILAYLDERIAENETVAIYLRLQREAIRKAFAAAERQAAPSPHRPSRPQRPAPPPAGEPDSSGPPPTAYVVEPKNHPKHHLPALYHLADCTMPRRKTSFVTPDQIRIALRDPLGYLTPCEFCAPDKTLDLAD